MGAWIETSPNGGKLFEQVSRTLCGCVDWNVLPFEGDAKHPYVAPYVGAWIETVSQFARLAPLVFVAPYVGAWIETFW